MKRHSVHKATFPIELPLTIVKCFPEAKIVLDPYMGIGTTAKAIIQLNKEEGNNRKFIGFEIDELYVNISNEDIKTLEENNG